ncbi:transcription elongation factor GreA [Candidatus Microgenomates bacterium]|nr:transcription elongation factor GreA [Candidatus Microgenomates bacterium]MBI2622319.1 transcription elongation factor GreA [Candidatus Microgenomates bacterium]
MDINKVYLTKEGLETIKAEHEELTKVKRPQILTQVSNARGLGDLSENAEYAAARDELSFIDGRIAELEELLKHALMIRDSQKAKNNHQVRLGSKVTLHVNGKKETFMVVGEWEADPAVKKISHESPLGKALIGKKKGEKVEVEAPAGKILYTIVDIR